MVHTIMIIIKRDHFWTTPHCHRTCPSPWRWNCFCSIFNVILIATFSYHVHLRTAAKATCFNCANEDLQKEIKLFSTAKVYIIFLPLSGTSFIAVRELMRYDNICNASCLRCRDLKSCSRTVNPHSLRNIICNLFAIIIICSWVDVKCSWEVVII